MQFSLAAATTTALLANGALAIPSAQGYAASAAVLETARKNGCSLPTDFDIRNVTWQPDNTTAPAPPCPSGTGAGGSGQTAPASSSMSFTYVDNSTNLVTFCQYNASSKSTTPEGLTPRYSCEDHNVKFIWQPCTMMLTMIERACPGSDGKYLYEATGSVAVSGPSQANYQARFVSLQPVRDPTLMKMMDV